MRSFCVAMILTCVAQGAVAQTPFVRVLLPLYAADPVPGAYGSLWQSQFAIYNGTFIRSYNIETCPPNQGCFPIGSEDERLRPGETQVGLPGRYPLPTNPVGGAVLYLLPDPPRDQGEGVAFQLRIVDLSRTATGAGTEVPVVREHEFRTFTIHLLHVPTDARFRLAVRLFEMNLERARFTVRVFDESTNASLRADLLTTTLTGQPGGFVPAFAELKDLLSGIAVPPAHLRVEIEPLTAGVASWAYVSITNNESQQITLITPQ